MKIYPGFSVNFIEIDKGNYLNVYFKTIIIPNETILEYLNIMSCKEKLKKEEIKEKIIGRGFKVLYTKKIYIIDDIDFDRNPKNQTFTYEGQTLNLIQYYEKKYKIKIKDEFQPLIIVRKKNLKLEPINLYFIPELSYFTGFVEETVQDKQLMKEISSYTKLGPNDRILKTNQFIDLLTYPTKKGQEELSAKEKSELYGIEVFPVNEHFTGYYIKEPKIICANKKEKKLSDDIFKILKNVPMKKWLCFYETKNYNDAENLYNTLFKVSKSYGLEIEEPEWIESQSQEWIQILDDYFGKNKKREYDFVVFLIDKQDFIYKELKRHSLCQNGYVSQVVKTQTLKRKGAMKVCSKILIQINSKLGGIPYMISLDKNIKEKKLMIIGIVSNNNKIIGTENAMVATINDSFTEFYNKEEIINEENKEKLQNYIINFLEEILNSKKVEMPKGIIIYRKGISINQKKYLNDEISQIEKICQEKNILYYYILVNTKNKFKFFEKSKTGYSNPGSGLLIIDGATKKNCCEFYIQPQEVIEGSATPTCFQIVSGNLNISEIIPKLTFDLCHIYSNWNGIVRVPNVIKAAEKLSTMTIDYTRSELNSKLRLGQSYL